MVRFFCHTIIYFPAVKASMKPWNFQDSEDDGPMVRAEKSTRQPNPLSPGAPLSIAELYQLCNQISKTMLVPIAEVGHSGFFSDKF